MHRSPTQSKRTRACTDRHLNQTHVNMHTNCTGAKIGYLPQDPHLPEGTTVLQAVLQSDNAGALLCLLICICFVSMKRCGDGAAVKQCRKFVCASLQRLTYHLTVTKAVQEYQNALQASAEKGGKANKVCCLRVRSVFKLH